MDALKQGNGFSPKLEAAPAEDAEEVTFAADPALLGRIATQAKGTISDLPLPVNEFVAGWINALFQHRCTPCASRQFAQARRQI